MRQRHTKGAGPETRVSLIRAHYDACSARVSVPQRLPHQVCPLLAPPPRKAAGKFNAPLSYRFGFPRAFFERVMLHLAIMPWLRWPASTVEFSGSILSGIFLVVHFHGSVGSAQASIYVTSTPCLSHSFALPCAGHRNTNPETSETMSWPTTCWSDSFCCASGWAVTSV